jgi:hypothetical protein
MEYNILNGALWELNTTIGNKFIDFNDMYLLDGYGSTPIFNLSGNDIFVMDFDFGHRIHLNRFEYKFVSSSDIYTVASGVSFFYKNESFDDYELMSTLVLNDNIFYTTVSGSIFAPRCIRMSHTISGTYGISTISGFVYGFSALSSDTIVGFGIDGNKTTEIIETARGSEPVIRSVAIYNSGSRIANAFVNLEPKFSPVDEVIYISNSNNGPWTKSLNTSELIADTTNFNYGYTTGLQVINGPLRMNGVDDINNFFATRFKSDYYISRVFEKHNTYCRFVMNNVGIGGSIGVDKTDAIDTIEVRSSNTPPIPYIIIRELVNIPYTTSYGNTQLRYRDRWLNTYTLKEDSSWTFLTGSYYCTWKSYKVVFDQLTERWIGYATQDGTNGSYSFAELYIFNNMGTSSSLTYRLSYQSAGGDPVNYSFKELKLDYTGGMWIYLYCQSYHSGDFIHASGYFLAYFDVNMLNTFKLFTVTEEIGEMDVDYNSKCVWYTKPTTNAIYKVSVAGDIVVSFIDADVTYKLGGIAVMPDSSLLYANGKDLHRLKANGIYLPEYFIEGAALDNIEYLVLDGDGSEAVWTIEGMTVGRIYIYGEKKGTYDFRVTLDYPTRMISVLGGAWVHCADIDGQGGVVMRFISKENRRVDREYRPNYNSCPGLLCQPYYHPNYTKKMPISIDLVWSNLSWKKVAINGFLAPEDQYHQLKVILRCQTPIERYPEFITNIDQEFISYDDFDQNENIPNKLLWGNWLNYPSINRVYVDTVNKKLVLAPEISSPLSSFIDTKNRLMVSRDSDGILDIRIRYTIGAGDGVNSTKDEDLYIYAYSLDLGYSGKYLGVCLHIAANPELNNCVIYAGFNDNWTFNNYFKGLNMYDGELRLYWNGSTVYGGRRDLEKAFVESQYSVNSNSVGNNFYIKIISNKDSSQVKIDNFNVYKGYTYYYTEGPLIKSIHKQELVEVDAIYPNNYKNVYIKSYVPKDLEIGSSYDMDMKVRWRVPTY